MQKGYVVYIIDSFTPRNYKDRKTIFADCVKLVNNNRVHDKQIFISTYPHAFYGFDNPEFPPKLERIDEKGEKYHVGYNAEARIAALKDLMIFFDKYLKI